MRYRYAAFDLDGTLIDSEQAVLRSLQDTLLSVTGREYPLSQLTFALGIPGSDCLTWLGIPRQEEALALWTARLRHYAPLVRLFPGVPAMMDALASLGIGLGVVTSKTPEELHDDFFPLGLGRYFPTVITAADTALHKPDPAPLRLFMERSGARPEETLFVGDSPYDASCAHRAGADFALAAWGCQGRTIPAEHTPASPMELVDILRA